ncbi:MAG: hypothetical protein ACKOCD_07425, partial [Nitrospiraceae bacterium]
FGMLLFLAVLSPASWAHEGSAHVMGTVTEVAADHVIVQTLDAKTVTIKTTAKTSYRTTKAASNRDALKVGHRVVAEVTQDATGMTASELRFSSVPPKAEPHK